MDSTNNRSGQVDLMEIEARVLIRRLNSGDCTDREERNALTWAVLALMEKTPKKVERRVTESDGVWCDCYCPLCGANLTDHRAYCSDCGQKLDWRDDG